mmetsp:Transcript_20788/g.30774  ORF Transcript_20788/g.30774 Transcript_20788/m.30774 type:complete len:293 (+) Transcript_20788:11-889(+)
MTTMIMYTFVLTLLLAIVSGSLAFVPSSLLYSIKSASRQTSTNTNLYIFDQLRKSFEDIVNSSSDDDSTKASSNKKNENYDQQISECLSILNAAASTKSEDPESVVTALEDLEQLMRKKCKAEKGGNPTTAQNVLTNLNGTWRLIFTTGTKTTQDRIKKTVNYFPIKAVQSFDTSTDPFGIENGIYLGDFAALKFSGPFEFDLIKRKLEFDFTRIALFNGLFDIQIKSGDAAKIGASTGLGSESNVKNVNEKGKKAFFNWISADANIATARGGGGGLALWRRIVDEEEEASE